MEKIKVLQVIGNLKIGGAEKVVMDYYRFINRDMFEFHYLVYGSEKGDYDDEVLKLGGKVVYVPYSSSKIFRFYNLLVKLIKDEKYNIVHSHTLFNSGIVMKAAKNCGVQHRITHSHSTKNKVNSNFILKVYESIMRKMIKKNSTSFFSCSEEAGEYLFGKEYFHTYGKKMSNGIETKKFTFDEIVRKKIRKEYNLHDDTVLLGSVGHLAPVKNQKLLLKILSKLDSEKYVLMLIGEGNEKEKLKSIARELNIEKRVIFTGNISNVNEYLSALDIFLFPSLFEGFGLAVIEAQTNGLPCIISNKVPNDVIVTDLVRKISIDKENFEDWVSAVKNTNFSVRKVYTRIVSGSGYELNDTIQNLTNLYIAKDSEV